MLFPRRFAPVLTLACALLAAPTARPAAPAPSPAPEGMVESPCPPPLAMPPAAFYYWVAVPGGDDLAFTRELFARQHVTVLPGTYIAREAHGVNPGRGFVRVALVSTVEETIEAAQRVKSFAETWAAAGVRA